MIDYNTQYANRCILVINDVNYVDALPQPEYNHYASNGWLNSQLKAHLTASARAFNQITKSSPAAIEILAIP